MYHVFDYIFVIYNIQTDDILTMIYSTVKKKKKNRSSVFMNNAYNII